MRLVFAGTPAFAVPALRALGRQHEVALVLTQPDRPAGRGMRLTPSAVTVSAMELGLPVEKPLTLRDSAIQGRIGALRPDALVVAAYGLMLPEAVLCLPRWGCLNIHASLLPRWRGAAPVHRALLAGDAVTGVSIMQMEAGLDTGPVLLERVATISREDTTGTLTERLANLGAEAVVQVLSNPGGFPPKAQPLDGVTYARKVTKDEARIDWGKSAEEVDRVIRAFNPAPGAEALLLGDLVKIWRAVPVDGRGAAGTVLEGAGLTVACGQGAIRIEEIQRRGARRMGAAEFVRGRGTLVPAPRN